MSDPKYVISIGQLRQLVAAIIISSYSVVRA